MKFVAVALFLGASAPLAPVFAQGIDPAKAEAIFAEATTAEFTAQIAGTYPARSEILVKVANGDQFALPVAAGSDLSVWRTNEVIDVVITQGAITEIAPAAVTTPEVSFAVHTEDVPGAPADAVIRTVTYSLPAERVTVEGTAITFIGPEGIERTAVVAEGVSVEPVRNEWVTLTFFDAVDVARK